MKYISCLLYAGLMLIIPMLIAVIILSCMGAVVPFKSALITYGIVIFLFGTGLYNEENEKS